MEFRRLDIPDIALIVSRRFEDSRGWFAEAYNAVRLKEFGIENEFAQDNQAFSREAGAARSKQLFIPDEFAHGYCTLKAETEVLYKFDAAYAPAAESGVGWNDSDLAISWPVDAKAHLPEKALSLSRFREPVLR
jgi:dTDP-4-dehydrorhamnose 3,5-epimerase